MGFILNSRNCLVSFSMHKDTKNYYILAEKEQKNTIIALMIVLK